MTFDFVKVTIKSRFCVGSTINFVHYVGFGDNKNVVCAWWVGNRSFWIGIFLETESAGIYKYKAIYKYLPKHKKSFLWETMKLGLMDKF